MTQLPGLLHRTVEVALSVGAVSGVLCVLWALASLIFGLTPLVLVSGSMSPAIETGDLAVARSVPAAEIGVGDVVSVETTGGVRVTHRVVSIRPDGSRASLVLQGDANATPDAVPYEVTSVDRVLFHVPNAGRAVAAVSGRTGMLVLAAAVAVLLLLGLGPASESRTRGGRRRAPRSGRRGRRATQVAVGVALVAVGAGVSVRSPTSTTAYFTNVDAMTASHAAYALPKPALTCESRSSSRLRFSWPAATSGVSVNYVAQVVNGAPLDVQVNGATRYVEVTAGLLDTILGSTRTVSVVAKTPVAPAWSSAAGQHNLTIGFLGTSVSCSDAGY